MQRETLLASVCSLNGNKAAAEIIRARLESGDLEPAGNFRDEPPEYWKITEEAE